MDKNDAIIDNMNKKGDNALDKNDAKVIGNAMATLEIAYHNTDMGYWFEDAPNNFESSGRDSDNFEEEYPVFLAEQYEELVKTNEFNYIDEILYELLDGSFAILEFIISDAINKDAIDALLLLEQYIKPEHRSYERLQNVIEAIKTLPLHNMKLVMNVMGKYMLHVKDFGLQSNDYGTIGKLVTANEPEEYRKYHIMANINPHIEGSTSRDIAILFLFNRNKVSVDFKISRNAYLNKEENVVGHGPLIHDLAHKEYIFCGSDDNDKTALHNLVCGTLKECLPLFKDYIKNNPDDRPVPFKALTA